MNFRRVLLLDSAMMPMKLITWQRAMILFFQQKATILSDQGIEISGQSWSYKIPSVIQLKNYIMKNFDSQVRFSRKNIFLRDEFQCQYCHRNFSSQKLTLEHVIPRTAGGRTSWINVVSACFSCNQKKGGRTPEEAGMRLFKKPVKPPAGDFFRFSFPDNIPNDWEPYVNWIRKLR